MPLRYELDHFCFQCNHLQQARTFRDRSTRELKKVPFFSQQLEIVAFKKNGFPRKGYLHIQRKSRYAIKIAQNFKREGVNSHEDLVWFAKLENYRYYTYNDPQVKQGLKKRGGRKEGEQLHVQVIVSRKDATNTIKLSPMNTLRGKNEEHSKKMGQFDQVAFKQSGESLFDNLFEFDRKLKETMAYANANKNGSLYDRIEMNRLDLIISEPDIELVNQDESIARLTANIEYSLEEFTAPINIDIRDDVDDEAVYGRNRHRKRPPESISR